MLAQVGMNYAQFGTATLSGYAVGGEGFAWLAPRLSTVLFSASRGLLVFSPAVALAAIGLALHARAVPGYVWPHIGNALAQVYLVAAWSSPGQGDAFGCRMLSDNGAVVAFGLALLFGRSPARWKAAVGGAALAAVGWTMLLLGRYVSGGHGT